MSFPSALRSLNHRDFRLFWAGQGTSLIGTWMQRVGQAWLVLELTNSSFALGAITALQWTPVLFLAFVAGAVADRVPKRRLIIFTQTALMTQALVLAALVWSGHVRVWHVAVLAGLLGIASTMDMPARQSFIAEMVGVQDLVNAIALNSGVFNAARIVGPAVAGVVVARYGVAPAFFLNGLSFLAVIGALLAIRTEGRPRPRQDTTMLQEIREGIHYAVSTPRIALLLSLLLAVGMFVMNFSVVVPLLARNVLHQGAHGFGFLMASLGVGAVAGAVGLAVLGHEGRPPLPFVVAPAFLVSAATLSLAAVRQLWLAAVMLFVIGFLQILFQASCNTTLQVGVPGELRGRMMSLYSLVFAGVTPIGSFLVGSVAEAFGVPVACATTGSLGLMLVAALTLRWRSRAAPR